MSDGNQPADIGSDDLSLLDPVELLAAARRERTRANEEAANVERATSNIRRAEDDLVAAKEREREAKRGAERTADNDRRKIAQLEADLQRVREAAAEMRGRLREARSNQMVRRGDIAPNPYASPDDEVPF